MSRPAAGWKSVSTVLKKTLTRLPKRLQPLRRPDQSSSALWPNCRMLLANIGCCIVTVHDTASRYEIGRNQANRLISNNWRNAKHWNESQRETPTSANLVTNPLNLTPLHWHDLPKRHDHYLRCVKHKQPASEPTEDFLCGHGVRSGLSSNGQLLVQSIQLRRVFNFEFGQFTDTSPTPASVRRWFSSARLCGRS